MPAPWLSVIVPAHNGERYLGEALASVAAEHDRGIEVVVVDDGSSDSTVQVASSFSDRLTLRVEHGVRRGSWTATSNRGLELAGAAHATFLHQDDRWRPGRAAALRVLVDRHPSAGLVVHGARFIDAAGKPAGRWSLPVSGEMVVDGQAFVAHLLVQNFLCVDAPVFRTADALAAGGLRTDLWYTADWDLWLRLSRGTMVVCSPSELVEFRVHAASQTVTGSHDLDGFREQLSTVFDAHFSVWQARSDKEREDVRRAARAAIELNVALAALGNGRLPHFRTLAAAVIDLRPASLRRLARDSRLHQRVAARLRARTRRRRWE